MRARFGHVLFLLFPLYISPLHATTISSYQNGNWNSVSTWQGGVIPGAGDTVLILTGDTVTLNDSRSCSSLWVQAGGKLNLNHTLGGYTAALNDGHVDWNNGTFNGTGLIENNGLLRIQGGYNHLTAGDILNTATGVIYHTGNNLDYDGGGAQTLTNHGIFNANPTGGIYIYMTIVNYATFQNSTAGTIQLYSDLTNHPGAEVDIGMATLIIPSSCDITQNGTFNVTNLNLNGGTHTLATSDGITGGGVLSIAGNTTIHSPDGWEPAFITTNLGSTLSGNTSLAIPAGSTWNWTTGTFSITGDITNSGILNITGAVNHPISCDIINTVPGVINHTGSHLDYNGGGAQTLTNYGVFNGNPTTAIYLYMTVMNHATFQNSTAGTIQFYSDFTNHPGATVNIGMATLVVNSTCDITQNGGFLVQNDMDLDGGTHTLAAADGITGNGALSIEGPTTINSVNGWEPAFATASLTSTLSGNTTLTIPSGSTWNWANGTFAISGDITNSGILNISGGNNHL
ncbi:MAG TPA: hypothetical protein VI603_06920, partial [Saprospiraceae bacterium]|nr:hypothetical protein [Saprospiraceae bacterium]